LVFPYPDLSEKEFTIVGIIRDVTHERLDPETKRTIYMSQRQEPYGDFMLIVRTDGEPMRYAPVIKERIQIADPSAAVSQVAAMDEIAKESLRGPRLRTSVLSLFAGLAVFLAASGLYGLLAHSVSRRTREIAVRMALGADARKITQLVTGQGLALALTGLIIGIMVALATTRFLSAILYGLSPTDSTTLAIATALIFVVSCVAAYVPARRAARLSPTTALRCE
jgi:ABC-type antimicrobial peptide transport system permease subunit